MLSEEEKKAINQLKADTSFYDYELKNGKYIYELFKIEVYKKDVDVLLNLIETQQKEISLLKDQLEYVKSEYEETIEQQQKEIEELKNSGLPTVYLNGFYDGEKKVKGKIKAKIEECREILYSFEKELELKAYKDKFIHKESMNCLLGQISILQSLLEEE